MRRRLARLALGMALAAAPASAITVDGQLDPAYTLMATQTLQTNGNDDTQALADFGNGSELDAAYAAVDNGTLYLFFAGNLKDTICGAQACTDFAALDVFLDTQAGGQNPLLAPAPFASGDSYSGLAFDAAFAPDHWFQYLDVGALDHSFQRLANYGALTTGGGGAGGSLGSGTNAGAPGTLSGGTNPFGVQATIDNRNVVGVAAGCASVSGAGATTGVELAIPLAAIGNPTGCVKVCALLVNFQGHTVLNQFLPPAPAGTCAATAASSTNLASLAGDQFFTFCPGATAARTRTWGELKLHYR